MVMKNYLHMTRLWSRCTVYIVELCQKSYKPVDWHQYWLLSHWKDGFWGTNLPFRKSAFTSHSSN